MFPRRCINSPRVCSTVGIEWEDLVARLRTTTGVVKRVAANQADAHKAPVGRSSLVSAIVSQDCDVRAALRNTTHARHALDTRLACGSPGSLRRVQKCVGYRCTCRVAVVLSPHTRATCARVTFIRLM